MKKFLLFFSLISMVHLSFAQCGWSGGSGYGTQNPSTTTQTIYVGSGTYTYWNACQGDNYYFATCGTGWDTQLTLYRNTGGWTSIDYNDDSSCGLQSEISYLYTAASTNQNLMVLNRFNCQQHDFTGQSATLQFRNNGPSAPPTPTGGGTYCESATLSASTPPYSTVLYYWQTSSTGSTTAHGSASTLSVTASGTWYLRAYNTCSGIWGGSSAGVSVTIDAQPTAVNSTTPYSMCEADSKTLSGSGGAGTWSIVSGPGSISGTTYNPGSISANASVTVRYTIVNGACSDFADVSFIVYNEPSITNTTSAAPLCAGASRSLSSSFTGTGNVSYTLVSGPGSISGTTYTAGSVSGSASVTVRARVQGVGSCIDFDDVTFTVYQSPTYTGSTASMCVGETRTLTATAPGTTFSGTGVSGNTFTAPDPGGVSGNYTITLTNGPCTSFVVLTVYATPTITSSAADMCVGDTRTLTASLGGGIWSGTGVSGNTFTAPTPSGASQTYTITYTTLGSPCAPVTQDITVYANPFAANAGEDKPACINNPATLSASNPPIGSGTWTWSPSAPVYAGGTTANDYNAQVTFSSAGSYRGIWTVTSGPCASTSSDTMYVNVSAANNNASLFSSAGAAAESIQAFEVCEEGSWTYYAAPGSPDEYLFAINKHGSSFTAYVDIVDLPGTQTIESLGGTPAIRGTWLIGRYWNVSLTSGSLSTTVDVRFFVDPAEVTQAQSEATAFLNNTAAATNMTALTFFKTVSTAFDPATSLVNGEFTFAPAYLPYTTGNLNGVTYYELTGLTSFSGGTGGFSVNDSGSPLPVELLEFNVSTVDNQFIRLDWATASEINNDGFEVLRSTDGVNFERIAWIGGNGNSTEINEYVFNDRGVDKGMTYYYQLKQIDYDGQYEYFDIKSARLDGRTTFSVGALVPNPSKGNNVVAVQIETVSGEVLTLDIYDRIGAKVKSMTYVLYAAENGLDIDISDLEEGTYFLSFESSMGIETRKLVVVK